MKRLVVLNKIIVTLGVPTQLLARRRSYPWIKRRVVEDWAFLQILCGRFEEYHETC
jgi:hypothetical protein